MAEEYKTITRIIEYYGPQDWLESVMANNRIPTQGVKQFQNGVYIKSGVIMWQPAEIEASLDSDNQAEVRTDAGVTRVSAADVKDNYTSKTTVVFKRPGEK